MIKIERAVERSCRAKSWIYYELTIGEITSVSAQRDAPPTDIPYRTEGILEEIVGVTEL